MSSNEPMTAPVGQPKPKVQNRRPGSLDWPFRLVIVALLAGSAALAWWSLWRLEPLQRQSRELNSTIARLSVQIEELERKWSRGQVEEVGDRFKQAHAQLFSDQPALENWMNGLKEQSESLALEAKTTFGKTIPVNSADQELAMIPTTVSVNVIPLRKTGQSAWPYRRLVQLSQGLARQDKRADLVEMTVLGGTNSVAGAVLVFNLWAGAEGRP